MQHKDEHQVGGAGEWTVCRICLGKCAGAGVSPGSAGSGTDLIIDEGALPQSRSRSRARHSYSLSQVSSESCLPFHRMIAAVTSIRVSADDGLPNKLCVRCALDVENAYSLKRKCEKSQMWLEKMLKDFRPYANGLSSVKREFQDDFYPGDAEAFGNEEEYRDALADFEINYGKVNVHIEGIKNESEIKSDHDAHSEPDATDDPDYSDSEDEIPIGKRKVKVERTRSSGASRSSFPCSECDYVGKNAFNLKQHAKRHNLYRPHGCDQCAYRCNSTSKLREHRKIHTGEKPYLCDQCHYTCRTVSNLNKHKSSKHSSERNFACDECDFKTKTKNALEVHKRRHSGDKRFVCEFCPYKAIQKARLEVHIKMVHTGERPYACDRCSYRCVDSSYLKIHLRTHCVKMFSCDECGYSCHTKFKLKMHKLTHTGEKPHKCSLCDFRCSRATLLKRHHKRIHKMEPKDRGEEMSAGFS